MLARIYKIERPSSTRRAFTLSGFSTINFADWIDRAFAGLYSRCMENRQEWRDYDPLPTGAYTSGRRRICRDGIFRWVCCLRIFLPRSGDDIPSGACPQKNAAITKAMAGKVKDNPQPYSGHSLKPASSHRSMVIEKWGSELEAYESIYHLPTLLLSASNSPPSRAVNR